jgi:hypothetical protein
MPEERHLSLTKWLGMFTQAIKGDCIIRLYRLLVNTS